MKKTRVAPHKRVINGRIVWVTGHRRKDETSGMVRKKMTREGKTMRNPNTPTEDDVYQVICWYFQEYGLGPTIQQIEDTLKWNARSTLVKTLDRLEKQGYIERPFGKSANRGIALPEIKKAASELFKSEKPKGPR